MPQSPYPDSPGSRVGPHALEHLCSGNISQKERDRYRWAAVTESNNRPPSICLPQRRAINWPVANRVILE